jgi:hypothetical protein
MTYHYHNNNLEKWLKNRRYFHFDSSISLDFARKYVKDPIKIEKHPFLPFLGYVNAKPRYQAKENKTKLKKRQILYASHLDWEHPLLAETLK